LKFEILLAIRTLRDEGVIKWPRFNLKVRAWAEGETSQGLSDLFHRKDLPGILKTKILKPLPPPLLHCVKLEFLGRVLT